MVEDCTLHTMQGATARQLGFVAFVIETQARGSVHQHLLLDDGTVVTRTQMMKTGRRRGGRIETREIISFFISIFFVLKFTN